MSTKVPIQNILLEKDQEIESLNNQIAQLKNELSSQYQTMANNSYAPNSMCNTGRPNSKNMTISKQAPIDYSQMTADNQSYRPYDLESSKYQHEDSYCPTPHESNGDFYINTTQDDNRDEKL